MTKNCQFLSMRQRQRGFTLIELMVALVVLGILVTVGIPGFQNIIRDNRATSISNELLGAVQFARSTAVSGESTNRVVVCPVCDDPNHDCNACGNDWQEGWMVLVEGPNEVLRSRGPFPGGVSINAPALIRFSNMGTVMGTTGDIDISIDVELGSSTASRAMTVFPSGFSRIDN